MRRRAVLAGVGALATLGGCSRLLREDPIDVRVMRVAGDDAEDAAANCRVTQSFVQSHPVLERVLESARNAPTGEWVTAGTDRSTGETLVADLHDHCDSPGGVYHFDGQAYRVRVETNGGNSVTPTSASSEAIRGRHPEDDP
jgi:hypothetical protein